MENPLNEDALTWGPTLLVEAEKRALRTGVRKVVERDMATEVGETRNYSGGYLRHIHSKSVKEALCNPVSRRPNQPITAGLRWTSAVRHVTAYGS